MGAFLARVYIHLIDQICTTVLLSLSEPSVSHRQIHQWIACLIRSAHESNIKLKCYVELILVRWWPYQGGIRSGDYTCGSRAIREMRDRLTLKDHINHGMTTEEANMHSLTFSRDGGTKEWECLSQVTALKPHDKRPSLWKSAGQDSSPHRTLPSEVGSRHRPCKWLWLCYPAT